MHAKALIEAFIETIWNRQEVDRLSAFLHPDYEDYSLPPGLPAGLAGTRAWILATGTSFEHHTAIVEQVCEGDLVVIRIRMRLKHTRPWRGIEATGAEAEIAGFRQFKIQDGKIRAHWALLDGQALTDAVAQTKHSCRVGA